MLFTAFSSIVNVSNCRQLTSHMRVSNGNLTVLHRSENARHKGMTIQAFFSLCLRCFARCTDHQVIRSIPSIKGSGLAELLCVSV